MNHELAIKVLGTLFLLPFVILAFTHPRLEWWYKLTAGCFAVVILAAIWGG